MSLLIDGMNLPEDTAEIRITWSNDGNWYARYKGTDDWHKVTESKDTKMYWIRTGYKEEIYKEELHCPACRCDVICDVGTKDGWKEPTYCPNCGKKLAED